MYSKYINIIYWYWKKKLILFSNVKLKHFIIGLSWDSLGSCSYECYELCIILKWYKIY